MGLKIFGYRERLALVKEKCISCGKPLSPEALFCEVCGPPSLPAKDAGGGLTKKQTAVSIAIMVFLFSTLVFMKLGMSFGDVVSALFPEKIEEQALAQDSDFEVNNYVNVKRANVRDQPNSDGKVLTVLGQGVKVKILEPGETWTKIDLNGKPGWIGTRLLTASIE